MSRQSKNLKQITVGLPVKVLAKIDSLADVLYLTRGAIITQAVLGWDGSIGTRKTRTLDEGKPRRRIRKRVLNSVPSNGV